MVKVIGIKSGMNNSSIAGVVFTVGPVGSVYLSDLTWTSATSGWGPVEKDKSNADSLAGDGLTLTLNGAMYTKGLGAHALSEIVYNLNSQYMIFAAAVGIDDEVGAQGSVTFEVWTDGVKQYDSGVLTGNSPAQLVNISVQNKNTLQLVVTNGGDNINFDHADWAGAMLTPKTTGIISSLIQLSSPLSMPYANPISRSTLIQKAQKDGLKIYDLSGKPMIVNSVQGNGIYFLGTEIQTARKIVVINK
jgi:hypothetical protein